MLGGQVIDKLKHTSHHFVELMLLKTQHFLKFHNQNRNVSEAMSVVAISGINK